MELSTVGILLLGLILNNNLYGPFPNHKHTLTPSHSHTLHTCMYTHQLKYTLYPCPLTPDRSHTSTPSQPHISTPLHQHTLAPMHPHNITPAHPHSLTVSHQHTDTAHPYSFTPAHPHGPHTLIPAHPHTWCSSGCNLPKMKAFMKLERRKRQQQPMFSSACVERGGEREREGEEREREGDGGRREGEKALGTLQKLN